MSAITTPSPYETLLRRLELDSMNSGACCGEWLPTSGALIASHSPASGAEIAAVRAASATEYETVIARSEETFRRWRLLPAPQRGLIVREIGEELRRNKEDLGALVSLEMGKILAEGLGEVQEMIDIADFAVGLSRQLYGLTMHSERAAHRMYEQWHPLGIVGVISAFNFPVAVWSWNALLALVCGDTVVWKPSLKTPLTAIATQKICQRVLQRHGWSGVLSLLVGTDEEIGERLIQDQRVPLISATGSCKMGRRVASVVAQRLGRTLLELGGNNGLIVMDDANLDLAVQAVLFGAVGTAGQRCTSIRRLFLHKSIAPQMTERLVNAYQKIPVGDPLEAGTLMGPLIDHDAVQNMLHGLDTIREQGGAVLYGGGRIDSPGGSYVEPTLVKAHPKMTILREEIFAPILYLLEFETLDEAIAMHNDVPQGLSSAIFTTNMISAETFLSARGSDCGLANVNIGTSGAEIGGAFGGEKDTGGGRESGSDAWKSYMRRQTVTINYSTELPLAQGISFEL